MQVTTNHSASSYGQPVIITDGGEVLDYPAGIKAIRKKLELNTTKLAEKCGVSRRTVEGWEQGRMPSTAALIIIKSLLESNKTPTKTKK